MARLEPPASLPFTLDTLCGVTDQRKPGILP
jgi:hypothetical protein